MKKILLILICASALIAQTHNVNSDTSIASINGVDTTDIASINGITWLGYGGGGGGATPFATLDFEEGDLTDFTDASNAGTTVSVSTTQAYTGTYSIALTGNGGYCDFSFTSTDTIWVQFAIYIPSASSHDGGGYGYMVVPEDGDDRSTFAMEGDGDFVGWMFGEDSGSMNSVSTNYTEDAWHIITIEYTNDATNSWYKMWVDGSSGWSSTSTIYTHSDNVTFVRVGHLSGTITGNIYLDDIKFFLEYPL